MVWRFGVAEIENDTVLNILAAHKDLRNRGWKIVHYNSPDARGVDVAAFITRNFKPLYSAPLFVKLPGGSKRFVFHPRYFIRKRILDGDTIHVMVNHWPSRSGAGTIHPGTCGRGFGGQTGGGFAGGDRCSFQDRDHGRSE